MRFCLKGEKKSSLQRKYMIVANFSVVFLGTQNFCLYLTSHGAVF